MRKVVLIAGLLLPLGVLAQRLEPSQQTLTPYQIESMRQAGTNLKEGSTGIVTGVTVGLLGVAIGSFVASQPGKSYGTNKNRTIGGIVMGGSVVLGVGITIGGAGKIEKAGGWLRNIWRIQKPQEQVDYENGQRRK